MSITLNLPPEIENALQEVAQATSQVPVDYATEIIVSHLRPVVSLLQREGRLDRDRGVIEPTQTIIDALHSNPKAHENKSEHVSSNRGFGFLKGRVSSEAFLVEKHAEAQREREKDDMRIEALGKEGS